MWKKLAWPFLALFAVLMFFFRSGGDDKEELEEIQGEAQASKVEAINAKAELDKEKIKHETKEKCVANAALSDADIIAGAISDYRARAGYDSGAGHEGKVAD